MPIKCIAIDVDGTLLNSHGLLTPRTLAAVDAAAEAGVRVVLATGRARARKSLAILEALRLDAPGVFMQGLLVYDGQGRVLRREGLSAAAIAQGLDVTGEHGFHTVAYCADAAYTAMRNHYTESMLRGDECDLIDVPSLAALDTAINKLVVFDDPARIPAVRAVLAAALNGAARLVSSSSDSVEILPPGASKGSAVAWLLPRLGVNSTELMALGDGENDKELIALAGYGVAMGNAHPAARSAATHITGSNDEDGVAQAIERLVLEQ